MSALTILVISLPFLFVIGTVVNALKDQKRLEQGALKKILQKRKAEREEYFKRYGRKMPERPYDDDDWGQSSHKDGTTKTSSPSSEDSEDKD